MKTIYISASLFIVMLISIIFSINYLNKVCAQFESMDFSMEKYVISGTWDKAYNSSIDFLNEWKDHSKNLSIFVDHKEMDNINNELWKLTQYMKSENKDESLASIYSIRFFIDHIRNMEKLNIQNIF